LALADYNSAIAIDSTDEYPYRARATALFFLGKPEEAIASLTLAIERNPKIGESYHNRGFIQASKKNWPKAIADYDQAIRLVPDSAKAYYNRAVAYRQSGGTQKAIVDFGQALKLAPDLTQAKQALDELSSRPKAD
jgi:tetratricopeptide (TPR) repeat protein